MWAKICLPFACLGIAASVALPIILRNVNTTNIPILNPSNRPTKKPNVEMVHGEKSSGTKQFYEPDYTPSFNSFSEVAYYSYSFFQKQMISPAFRAPQYNIYEEDAPQNDYVDDEGRTHFDIYTQGTFRFEDFMYFEFVSTSSNQFLKEKVGNGHIKCLTVQTNVFGEKVLILKNGLRYYCCLTQSTGDNYENYTSLKYVDGFEIIQDIGEETLITFTDNGGDKYGNSSINPYSNSLTVTVDGYRYAVDTSSIYFDKGYVECSLDEIKVFYNMLVEQFGNIINGNNNPNGGNGGNGNGGNNNNNTPKKNYIAAVSSDDASQSADGTNVGDVYLDDLFFEDTTRNYKTDLIDLYVVNNEGKLSRKLVSTDNVKYKFTTAKENGEYYEPVDCSLGYKISDAYALLKNKYNTQDVTRDFKIFFKAYLDEDGISTVYNGEVSLYYNHYLYGKTNHTSWPVEVGDMLPVYSGAHLEYIMKDQSPWDIEKIAFTVYGTTPTELNSYYDLLADEGYIEKPYLTNYKMLVREDNSETIVLIVSTPIDFGTVEDYITISYYCISSPSHKENKTSLFPNALVESGVPTFENKDGYFIYENDVLYVYGASISEYGNFLDSLIRNGFIRDESKHGYSKYDDEGNRIVYIVDYTNGGFPYYCFNIYFNF